MSPGTVGVPEGGTAAVRVRLSAAPAANVGVTVARASGDPDVTVVAGSALVFTPADWSTEQSVTLAAAQDADTAAGTAVFTLAGPGTDSAALTATEADDDQPAPAACQVAYHVDSAWAGGFTATVTLRNTGPTALQGWSLGWSFPADQRITNAWNAVLTQSGAGVTAKDLGWNGAVAPGGTASFGFQADRTGANDAPVRFTLNGAVCA
ncbi:cellulose binding domain-containing protein [Kitasatospora indigofera]|uniref:cellulose binding domain-containing protein n=1 Tax=Kitasatospora indigofera TaxID=67307 RepID=UPI0036C5EDDD